GRARNTTVRRVLEYRDGSHAGAIGTVGAADQVIPFPRGTGGCVTRKSEIPAVPVGLPITPPGRLAPQETVRAGPPQRCRCAAIDPHAVNVMRRIRVLLAERSRLTIPGVVHEVD